MRFAYTKWSIFNRRQQLLNLINQPQLLLGLFLNDLNTLNYINYLKVFLTYLVPYFVSLYGALSVLHILNVNDQNQT